MKKILVVTIGSTTEKSLFGQVKSTLGELAEVRSIRCNEYKSCEGYDLVIFSSPDSYKYISSRYEVESPIIIAERVVNHKSLIKVVALPKNSSVLLVNDSYETAYEAIKQLRTLGIDHVKFTAYYPGCEIVDFSKYDIAVTLGEPQLIPEYFNNPIDIGTRIIAIKSIHDIVEKLGLSGRFNQKLTERYIKDIVDVMKVIEDSRKQLLKSEKLLESIINNVDNGILCLDDDGTINRINSRMESIAGKRKKDIVGKSITEVLGIGNHSEMIGESVILDIYDKRYICSGSIVKDRSGDRYVITLENVNRLRHKEIKMKEYYRNLNHIQMHSFDDYMTLNEKNKKLLVKAKRFSKTDSNILIQGENGTGKEILAQAIHRESPRRDELFLPVNITAISDSLLESELFGYEPGTFTGADKNGKVGIFEKAEGGTIFIDEIGDAPLNIQARLLRVIQEKRIRRVGGLEEIPVNVRIVAATNKDLLTMTKSAQFREDLYFRLNVLPLSTIPLRERSEDILYLLKMFIGVFFGQKQIDIEEILDHAVIELLEKHTWRGNVRELQNVAEFIQAVYDDVPITIDELPEYLRREISSGENVRLDYIQFKILGQLSPDHYIGRRKIADELQNDGIDTTEGQVRGCLKGLEKMSLVESIDRKGVRITMRGVDIHKKYVEQKLWDL